MSVSHDPKPGVIIYNQPNPKSKCLPRIWTALILVALVSLFLCHLGMASFTLITMGTPSVAHTGLIRIFRRGSIPHFANLVPRMYVTALH